MIRLTSAGKKIYHLMSQIVILLLLYAIVMLLSELQSLPIPTLLSGISIDFEHVTNPLFELIILTGLIVGGLMMSLDHINHQHLQWVYRAWVAIVIISIMGTAFLNSPLFDLLPIVGLVAFLSLTLKSEASRFLRIWQMGIVLIIVSLLVRHAIGTPSLVFQTHVAYGITAVSITFWLMTRWSNVRDEWVNDGVMIVSGLVAISGLLMSLGSFDIPSGYGLVSFLIVPCFIILAGHHYRALRDRNQDMSLSAHWIAVATVYWLLAGFMGVLSVQSGIQTVMTNTGLAEAQILLIQTVMLLIVLGLVNYIASYLRGENRRVTGFMPLWLIGFGQGFVILMTGSAGVVEIYLREFAGMDNLMIDGLLLPLTLITILCQMSVAFGIIIYALGFVARRPKIMIDTS